MEGTLTPTAPANRSLANAPFGHYYIPRLSQICLPIELVGRPSLCLLDFVRNLSVEEGQPLYIIYSPKTGVVNRHECVDEWKGWLIENAKHCEFACVKDVDVQGPVETVKKQEKRRTKPKRGRRRTFSPDAR